MTKRTINHIEKSHPITTVKNLNLMFTLFLEAIVLMHTLGVPDSLGKVNTFKLHIRATHAR